MAPRNWCLLAAAGVLAVAGCQLQQAGPAPFLQPIAKPSASTAPVRPSVAQTSRQAIPFEEEPSYALVAIEHDDTPAPAPVVQSRPVTPEDALKRSILMQELPTGSLHLATNAVLSIETPTVQELQPAKKNTVELVSGPQITTNTVQAPANIIPAAKPLPTTAPPAEPSTIILTSTPRPPESKPEAVKPIASPEPQKLDVPMSAMTKPTPMPRPAVPPSSPPPANGRNLLNSTSVSLNYRVGKVGPSGISKVEVWVTNDQGNTWQRLCEDFDRRSPSELRLPGEGVWGIRLVGVNGNGFGGTAPRRGEQPNFTVEVDMTNPRVTLGAIEPAEGQLLDIRWQAQDSNLGATAVTILYRTQPNQPWQLVANQVPNNGHFRWQFPREQPHFWFRIQVTDEAGNMTAAETPAAVAVDLTVPHLVVVGVSGAAKR